MQPDIKAAIYKVKLFDPENNGGGYSIDSFYYYSDELIEYSSDVLKDALNVLHMEGYLKREIINGEIYYYATREGKIARQKHFAQNGILSNPLVKQKYYSLGDLILAILASNHVDPFYGSDSISLDALSIYLHEFTYDALMDTKAELEDAGLIREGDWITNRPLHITGRGLQKYKTDSRIKLNLGQSEGVLRLIEVIEKDARFSKLGFDASLQENLEQRWLEMESCAIGKAYLAAVIMLGSILEGALLAKLMANQVAAINSRNAPKDKNGKIKPLESWTLAEYIGVSIDLSYVPKSVKKHSHELRDTRNFVHPWKQIQEEIGVDESLYRISREIAETVIDALSISK